MYKELFKPGKIGNMTLKNRIFMTPMGTGSSQNPDGGFSERLKDYFEARAKGGAGLIFTGSTVMTKVTEVAYARKSMSTVFLDDSFVGGASEMCDAVHRWGAKMCIQLIPGDGRLWSRAGERPVAPSDGIMPLFPPFIPSRGATVEELKQILSDYRRVAGLCRLAGFDAIELRASGGYFTDQFMSTTWNKRTDEYGGDLDGRLRFLMESIQAIKDGAGADFPIIVKYSPVHYFEGGRTLEEGIEIAKRCEAAGTDALHIEHGSYENIWELSPPQAVPFELLNRQLEINEVIRKAVNIPILGQGRFGVKPEVAEQALADGKLDFVGLGRSLICEPEWPNKVRKGQLEDIRPCIGCQIGCFGRMFTGKYVSCALNPEAGNEKNLKLVPACDKKSVLVIGGGPGGAEAALIAAKRGHDVTLMEKEQELGGALRVAGQMPFKFQMNQLKDYFTVQLEEVGVKVECGKVASREIIKECKPDVVVVATGSKPKIIKEIPGIMGNNVFTAEQVLFNKELLSKLGKKVVIAGGGEVGCEMAMYLSEQCPDVETTIVEMLPNIVMESFVTTQMFMRNKIRELGFTVKCNTKLAEIRDKQVDIESNDVKETIDVDTVIIAMGYVSDNKLAEELTDVVDEIHVIGDCVRPRKVFDAVWEGFNVGSVI